MKKLALSLGVPLLCVAVLLFSLHHSKEPTMALSGKEGILDSMNVVNHPWTNVSGLVLAFSQLHDNKTSLAYHDPIADVKKFVFFVGYGRSGHSIIGALMDAHPHVVIAHEFFLFSRFPELNKVPDKAWKNALFAALSKKSAEDLHGQRAQSKKGYTLEVKGLWQGKFDEYIEVIGDKSGGTTTMEYLRGKDKFRENFARLKHLLSIPVRVIYAVRNPFDIISTKVAYHSAKAKLKKNSKVLNSSVEHKLMDDDKLSYTIEHFFKQADAVTELIEDVFGRENVLEVHNCDLVNNPRGTLSRIFDFIEVDASEEFLDVCSAKVFKSVSRSRDKIEWTLHFRMMVEDRIRDYQPFNRYSFTSD